MRILAERSQVATGDVLVTERDSYANIRFSDGAQMTLKPSSSVRIDEFRFEEGKAPEDKFLVSLVAGGVRMVTGIVGSRSRDKFQMGTATATIAIRGTAFTVEDCMTSSEGCAKLEPGIYISVSDGSVEVSNALGQLVLNAGFYSRIARGAPPSPFRNPGLGFTPPAIFSRPGASGPKPVECVLRR